MGIVRSTRTVLPVFLMLILSGPHRCGAQESLGPGAIPYQLYSTLQRDVVSRVNGVTYRLYVSLPRSWNTPEAASSTYPVLYLLDPEYSFAIAHNQVWHFVDRDDMPEVILVGITYPGAIQDLEVYRHSRTRDYTPIFSPRGGYGPEYQKDSGGADRFLDTMEQDIFPLIERTYRGRSDDRGLVGHSYGGLFATYAVLTRPGLFRRAIIVSPSYWYADRMIFDVETERYAAGPPLAGRFFMSVGSREGVYDTGPSMVEALQMMVDRLRSRGYPDLHIAHHPFPDETHNSVFPSALTRGLLYIYGSGD